MKNNTASFFVLGILLGVFLGLSISVPFFIDEIRKLKKEAVSLNHAEWICVTNKINDAGCPVVSYKFSWKTNQ